MQPKLYQDRSYNTSNNLTYETSIQVSLNGLSIFISDRKERRYLLYKHYELFIPRVDLIAKYIAPIIDSDPIFSYKYSKLTVIYNTPVYTVVPTIFSTKSSNLELLAITKEVKFDDIIRAVNLGSSDQTLIFAIPTTLDSLLTSKLSNYTHIESNIYRHYMLNSNLDIDSNITVHFDSRSVDIIVMRRSNIVIASNFYIESDTDLLYYTLSIISEYKLDPSKCRVRISGDISRLSPHYHNLKQYIKDIGFEQLNRDYSSSHKLHQIPEHHLYQQQHL